MKNRFFGKFPERNRNFSKISLENRKILGNFTWKIEIFVKLPEINRNFSEISPENDFFLWNCLKESKFFKNFPRKSKFFDPGPRPPQISNQIDAAVCGHGACSQETAPICAAYVVPRWGAQMGSPDWADNRPLWTASWAAHLGLTWRPRLKSIELIWHLGCPYGPAKYPCGSKLGPNRACWLGLTLQWCVSATFLAENECSHKQEPTDNVNNVSTIVVGLMLLGNMFPAFAKFVAEDKILVSFIS